MNTHCHDCEGKQAIQLAFRDLTDNLHSDNAMTLGYLHFKRLSHIRNKKVFQ